MKSSFKIRVRGLKKSFGSKVVLDGIDLDLHAGESFVVIGGSGTGKSVLIKCSLGNLPFYCLPLVMKHKLSMTLVKNWSLH